MNIIKLNLYGEGYYSGSSYDETMFLLEEDYKKLGIDLNGEEVCLGELDGKHSEVYGEITVRTIKDEEQESLTFEKNNDGDTLYYHIQEYSDEIDDMLQRVESYIKGIDYLVDIKYRVKKSEAVKIEKFISENIESYRKNQIK